MKKQWISVKCGLSRDPKHRQVMGESVWLFLHMLDTASWDDGIVHDWKDEDAAEEMGMPVRTLREHRRKLAELGYITCNQKQYTQDIVIHNWTNPREYSGKTYNQKQGDTEKEPSESQGDTQGYMQGNRKDVTPTYNSKNQKSTKKKAAEPQPTEILIFKEVVRHYPKQNQRESVIIAIQKICTRLGRMPTVDDLRGFWTAWGKVSGNEWSLVWLDWAVSGVIPQQGKQQQPINQVPKGINSGLEWLKMRQQQEANHG